MTKTRSFFSITRHGRTMHVVIKKWYIGKPSVLRNNKMGNTVVHSVLRPLPVRVVTIWRVCAAVPTPEFSNPVATRRGGREKLF